MDNMKVVIDCFSQPYILLIFSYFNLFELLNLKSVCKNFNEVIKLIISEMLLSIEKSQLLFIQKIIESKNTFKGQIEYDHQPYGIYDNIFATDKSIYIS